MFIAILLLLVGFVILIKGADFLVEGAASVAKNFGLSDIIIGLTIVSFGTSAPELVVNINAALEAKNGMIFGNVLGSNIYNTCLILGVAGLIYPLAVQRNTVWIEMPFSLFIVAMVYLLGNDIISIGSPGSFSRGDGILLFALFLCFLAYVSKAAMADQKQMKLSQDVETKGVKEGSTSESSEDEEEIVQMPLGKSVLYIILGIIGLIGGGNLVLDNAVSLAEDWGMSDRVIGLTVVAIGTSLPELATSAVAAMKKNSDIALGNVVGSNIFNILLVLAVSTMVAPVGYDVATNLDLYFLSAMTLVLFGFFFIGKESKILKKEGKFPPYFVAKWQSAILLVAVFCYTVYLIVS